VAELASAIFRLGSATTPASAIFHLVSATTPVSAIFRLASATTNYGNMLTCILLILFLLRLFNQAHQVLQFLNRMFSITFVALVAIRG
jgi:uncharacterized membrane protein